MANCEASNTICNRNEEEVNGSLVPLLPSTFAKAFGTTICVVPCASAARTEARHRNIGMILFIKSFLIWRWNVFGLEEQKGSGRFGILFGATSNQTGKSGGR